MPARGRNVIKVEVTGIRGIAKALNNDAIYRDAMRRVIQSATSQGAKRIQALVPERSGSLALGIRQRYFDPKSGSKPQMGSVGAGSGISATGFRYGWALNYAKQVRGKNTVGYKYSKLGSGNSASRAGQSTIGWISKAVPTMKAVIRRTMSRETKVVEDTFGRIARSTP
jgi:hypothetical protein